MKQIIDILNKRIQTTMASVTGLDDCRALVKQSTDPKFGDYQANGVMAAAKQLKTNSRQLAEKIVAQLNLDDICQPPEIAGPGFINLRLKNQYLEKRLLNIKDDPNRLGIDKTQNPKTVVVDFSCPNIAKQMHVGHLRSTIIGDAVCRLLEFQGHKEVIRQNHIGDWGTQFGMLIAFLLQQNPDIAGNLDDFHITNLEQFYRDAKQKFDTDADFADTARKYVVTLQSHDETAIKLWKHIVSESRSHYQPIYDTLAVNLHEENERGESFYNDLLPEIVKELTDKGLAKESDGAICTFPEGFTNKQNDPLPFIIQKTDGAYLYATTDLAALRYRIKELNADRIIYVTDSRQKQHFEMLFATAKMAGWITDNIKIEHVMFGTVLGPDNRPLKTRSGENVKLKDLLDQSVERALTVVEQKNPDLGDVQKQDIAKAVGIGAVKYADYSNNRTSDYIFSFDKMLAMEGNTAPYMQYAYARVKSIERKAQTKNINTAAELADVSSLDLTDPAELDLAKHLTRYDEAIASASADCRPNILTNYLFELAGKFSVFYNACPVLDADDSKRPTRLLLCDLTANTIKHGLSNLLGIDVVQQM